MKFKEVFKIDKKLGNGGSNIVLKHEGTNVFMQIFDVDTNDLCYELVFTNVIAFRHFMEGFALISESYEKLIEIEDSEWLLDLNKNVVGRFDALKPRHFALYTHNDAQYEIVAINCKVTKGDGGICCK